MQKQAFYFKVIPRLEDSNNIYSKSSNSNDFTKIKKKVLPSVNINPLKPTGNKGMQTNCINSLISLTD